MILSIEVEGDIDKITLVAVYGRNDDEIVETLNQLIHFTDDEYCIVRFQWQSRFNLSNHQIVSENSVKMLETKMEVDQQNTEEKKNYSSKVIYEHNS